MKGLNILPADIAERLTHMKAAKYSEKENTTRKVVMRFFSTKPAQLERSMIREEELASKRKMYLLTLSDISICPQRAPHLAEKRDVLWIL